MCWLRINGIEEGEAHLRVACLNRKQIVDENGLSLSQSHLIVNIKLVDPLSESMGRGKVISFVDVVGFDEGFTSKIVEGRGFGEILTNVDEVNESRLQEIISECNDNDLYSLRNLLIAIESENHDEI